MTKEEIEKYAGQHWCCHVKCPHRSDGTTCRECRIAHMTNKEATK